VFCGHVCLAETETEQKANETFPFWASLPNNSVISKYAPTEQLVTFIEKNSRSSPGLALYLQYSQDVTDTGLA
jgi:hypothetical protein